MQNTKNFCLLSCFLLFMGNAMAAKVYWVGHSLVNHNMPQMVGEFARSLGHGDHVGREQIINGSPLKNSWNQSSSGEGGADFKKDYGPGGYEVLVFTEAVPLENHLLWNGTYDYGHRFCDSAQKLNGQSKCYLYETWHCINSGTNVACPYDGGTAVPWRQRLSQDQAKWNQIADSITKLGLPGSGVKVIPVGQAMARLYDSIAQKKMPGLDSIRQIFADDIHMNDLGNYYVALVQFAVIYGRSPVGATLNPKNPYGVSYQVGSRQDLLQRMQGMAWETVCAEPRTGVNCGIVVSQPTKPFSDLQWSNRDGAWYPNQDLPQQNWFLMAVDGKILAEGEWKAKPGESLRLSVPQGTWILKFSQSGMWKISNDRP